MSDRLLSTRHCRAPRSRSVGPPLHWLGLGLCLLELLFAPQPASSQEPPADPPSETVEKDPQLPKLKEMPVPTSEELIKGPPVDWIVLKNEGVIVCEPVQPRPDALAKMQQRIEETKKWPRPVGKDEIQEHFRKREALNYLIITLPGEMDDAEYQLHIKFIAQVIHHEDLMLKRVDLFLDEEKLREAFELLFVLDRNSPGWPGTAGRQKRLMLFEALASAKEGQAEDALSRLEELHERDPKFAGLTAAFRTVIDALVTESKQAGDFPRARHYLERLRQRDPQHEAVSRWKEALQSESAATIAAAKSEAAAGRHAEAVARLRQAARIWPATPGLAESFRSIAGRYQVLSVGVVRLAAEPSDFPFPTSAELRTRRLTETSLFEWDSFEDAARYRSPILEAWEPIDLGRRTQLLLKPLPAASGAPVLTAMSVQSALAARLSPASSDYDERLAVAVKSLDVRTPQELEIRFSQAPLRLEPLLTAPLYLPAPSHGGIASARDPASETGPAPLAPRFLLAERQADRHVYRRATPEPDVLTRRHLAQLEERKFPSHEKALQALLRGDVSMLPSVPSEEVDRLRQDNRFFVVKTALPMTHLIQIHPASRPLRQRELRRALAYALDRETLLKSVVLKAAPAERGRLISGPYPTKSVANNRSTPLAPYDPVIASALALAAKKPLRGEIPELRLICVPEPVALEAAARCVAYWKQCGIPARLVTTADAADGAPWDLCYRTLQMAEPAFDLWPLLTNHPRARVEDLRHLPQWLSRELVALDQAVDMSTAISLLKRLHDRLSAEMELIPLWEVDEFLAIRKNVRQFRAEPVHPYQDLEQWVVDPWFPTEPL